MFTELYKKQLNAISVEAMEMSTFQYCEIDLSSCLNGQYNWLSKTLREGAQTLSALYIFQNIQAARKMSFNVQKSVTRSPAVRIFLS